VIRGTRPAERNLFKIVDDRLLAGALENFFDKLDVLRVDLIGLLRRLAGKNQVQRDLISLIHDRAWTGRHFTDVKLNDAGNRLEIFVGTGDQFVGGVRQRRVGPEDDDVREHGNIVFSPPQAASEFRAKMSGGQWPFLIYKWRAKLAKPIWFSNELFIRFCTGSARCRFGLAGLAGLFLITGCATGHRNPVLSEERAAYVIGFGEFVEWPAAAFTDSNAPVVIGIYGPGTRDEKLQSTVPGRRINGREVVIRSFQSEAEISQCQVLFISGFQQNDLAGLVARLNHASVLTVSEDVYDFNGSGVMINLFSAGGKTLFEINRDAADRAGLKISSKLLALAQPSP
jgi:hypothetical protein